MKMSEEMGACVPAARTAPEPMMEKMEVGIAETWSRKKGMGKRSQREPSREPRMAPRLMVGVKRPPAAPLRKLAMVAMGRSRRRKQRLRTESWLRKVLWMASLPLPNSSGKAVDAMPTLVRTRMGAIHIHHPQGCWRLAHATPETKAAEAMPKRGAARTEKHKIEAVR
jgi:hypothetical protein